LYIDKNKPFHYHRKIHFADTDSAGVVYFASLLSICHEAYEEYLTKIGVNLHDFFQNDLTAIPIIHAQIDFFQPLFCGDSVVIQLLFNLVNQQVFEINYQIFKQDQSIARALTRHITINPQTRKTQPIPNLIIKNLSP